MSADERTKKEGGAVIKKKREGSQGQKATGWLQGSLILGSLLKGAEYLYKKAKTSLIGGALSYYPEAEVGYVRDTGRQKGRNGEKPTLGERLTGLKEGFLAGLKRVKRFVGHQIDNSVGVGLTRKLSDAVMYMPLRSMGITLCTSGMYILLIAMLRYFVLAPQDGLAMDYLITGIVLVISSMPMLVSSLTLAQALVTGRASHFFVFRVLGVRESSIPIKPAKRQQSYLPFICGSVLGVAAYFISPPLIFAAILMAVLMYQILRIPECGVVFILLGLPFLPIGVMAALNLYTCGCYLLKWIRGKRLLRLEKLDSVVLLYGLTVLLGGIFSVTGSPWRSALLAVSFMTGYFLVVNTVRTGEWVRRCMGALTASAAALAVIGLAESLLGQLAPSVSAGLLDGSAIRTLAACEMTADYLILTFPFALAMLCMAGRMKGRLFAAILCAAAIGCLIYTRSWSAWIACLASVFCFMLLSSKKTVLLIFAGLAALPMIPFVMPRGTVERMLGAGSVAESVGSGLPVWQASAEMARDYFFTGIGLGSDTFRTVYQYYAHAGMESAASSQSLYLQIQLEYGIFGLALFLLIILLATQSCFAYLRTASALKNSTEDAAERYGRSKLLITAGMAAVTGMMVQGLMSHPWQDMRIFFLFWLILGLTQGVRRSAGAETAVYRDDTALDILYR